MSLPVPVVGQEPGPQFATDVNASLTIIDSHNHTNGSGVQIPPAGLNINSDLSFGSNNAINLRSTRYTSQASPLALAADLQCLYVSGVDLYYNDSNGNQVRITQSGAVSGTPGSIANLVAPASASYNALSSTFVWQSAANTAANMDAASYILRNLTANSFGVTLSPPNALAADYTVVLPALPVSQSFLTIDASGNMGAPIAVSGGITNSNIADGTITGSKLVNGTITGTQILTNVNLAGNNVQENGNYIVVANTNGSRSLGIIYGRVDSSGTKLSGEGFSSVRTSLGVYTISFTSGLGEVSNLPAINLTLESPSGLGHQIAYTSLSTTGFIVRIDNGNNDFTFSLIAIGLRG